MARGASAERPGTGIPTGHSGTQLPAPTSCLRSPAQQEEKERGRPGPFVRIQQDQDHFLKQIDELERNLQTSP